MWKAWFDGAADPNPGPAGIGALLRGPKGEKFEIAEAIGHGTNNEAEYRALIAVLTLAEAQGVQEISVFGDSKLVVNQVAGSWACNAANLQGYCQQARALIGKFKRATIDWVPREKNTEADALSKKALGITNKPPQWGNQTVLGQMLNMTAVAVGKRLNELGLRKDSLPTEAALAAKLARVHDTNFGPKVEWNLELVIARLRA
jgi:ribonuclease HI